MVKVGGGPVEFTTTIHPSNARTTVVPLSSTSHSAPTCTIDFLRSTIASQCFRPQETFRFRKTSHQRQGPKQRRAAEAGWTPRHNTTSTQHRSMGKHNAVEPRAREEAEGRGSVVEEQIVHICATRERSSLLCCSVAVDKER